jgi:hypothetical protein
MEVAERERRRVKDEVEEKERARRMRERGAIATPGRATPFSGGLTPKTPKRLGL